MTESDARTGWQRLMHRWFVQYNPLYLVSAALVLVGVNLLSAELVKRGFFLGQLGVPVITELYAWALIGGAALLTRIEHERPAVMLALLAAFYQCDVSLHTETCVYLGGVGAFAAGVWWLSFVAKLVCLCKAVRLRVERSVLALPSFAALGLVVVPRLLRVAPPHADAVLWGGLLFAVFAWGLWSTRNLQPTEALDAWGGTVLRRALRAVWAMWGTLFALHMLFLRSDYRVDGRVLFVVALLLATRFVRREAWVWALVTATVLWTARHVPAMSSFTALLAAVVLVLRAFRQPRREQEAPPASSSGPYRHTLGDVSPPTRVRAWFGPASADARIRLLTGSLFAGYLSLWTLGWTGGAWPAHVMGLDAALTLVVVLGARRLRVRWPVMTLAVPHLHHALALGLVGLPSNTLQWSVVLVATGFLLLAASLAASYLASRRSRSTTAGP